MYTTIRDVMADYRDAAYAAGANEADLLGEDAVRQICMPFGRYEDMDRGEVLRAIFEAMDSGLACVLFA